MALHYKDIYGEVNTVFYTTFDGDQYQFQQTVVFFVVFN